MPRKSSFLMGFETGSALMRGAQADARARQQAAMNARLNERRLQAMDAELRAEQEKRRVAAENKGKAFAALKRARDHFNEMSGEAKTLEERSKFWVDWRTKVRPSHIRDIYLDGQAEKIFSAWEAGLEAGEERQAYDEVNSVRKAMSTAKVARKVGSLSNAAETLDEANNYLPEPIDQEQEGWLKRALDVVAGVRNAKAAASILWEMEEKDFTEQYLMVDGTPKYRPAVMAEIANLHKAHKMSKLAEDERTLKKSKNLALQNAAIEIQRFTGQKPDPNWTDNQLFSRAQQARAEDALKRQDQSQINQDMQVWDKVIAGREWTLPDGRKWVAPMSGKITVEGEGGVIRPWDRAKEPPPLYVYQLLNMETVETPDRTSLDPATNTYTRWFRTSRPMGVQGKPEPRALPPVVSPPALPNLNPPARNP